LFITLNYTKNNNNMRVVCESEVRMNNNDTHKLKKKPQKKL